MRNFDGLIRTIAFLVVPIMGCNQDRLPTAPARDASAVVPGSTLVASLVTVTNTNDNGPGSLREAVAAATDGSTVQFDPAIGGQTIELDSALVVADKTLIIDGSASDGITLDGGGTSLVLHLVGTTADLTLRNVTVTDGGSSGIRYDGQLTLEYSTVSGNDGSADGGISGTLDAVSLTLVNSTVSNNTARTSGGGIRVVRGDLTLINSTVVNNAVSDLGQGGGIQDITNAFGDRLSIKNSVIANNTAFNNPNCFNFFATLILSGKNVFGDTDCGSGSAVIIADPKLGALADNGGPTPTHEPLRESPVIDAATDCTVADDQRHIGRPLGAACDIGAVEFNDYVSLAGAIDASSVVKPKTGIAVVTGSITCVEAMSLQLKVTVKQAQKNRRTTSIVQGSSSVTASCNGVYYWSVAIAPSSGAFINGSAAATLEIVNPPLWLDAEPIEGNVQLYWGHR